MTYVKPAQATHSALWLPSWYELDQSIRVGIPGRFLFFRKLPDWVAQIPEDLKTDFELVFFNQLLNDPAWEARTAEIVQIWHPQLGLIESVDTYGLDYRFQLASGAPVMVNAEENPGYCDDLRAASLKSWGLIVSLTNLSEPLPRTGQDSQEGQGVAF